MNDPYEAARMLKALFGAFEYGLKRSGHLVKGCEDARADWSSFAKTLGPEFFDRVVSDRIAETLITDPPRKQLREGLKWQRRGDGPLKNIDELFTIGVCRVRNSLIHGEKFVGGQDGQWDRDCKLVCEALEVLQLALAKQPTQFPTAEPK
jgi:hypothetical protein